MEAMLAFYKQLKYLKMFCDINDIILILIKNRDQHMGVSIACPKKYRNKMCN